MKIYYNIELENIQLFNCAIIGKKILFTDNNRSICLVFPCLNAGFWDNEVIPNNIPVFIDKAYLFFYGLNSYNFEFSIFGHKGKEEFHKKSSNKFVNSYLEGKQYLDFDEGFIWGEIQSENFFVGIDDDAVYKIQDDSLYSEFHSNEGYLRFLTGNDLHHKMHNLDMLMMG